MAKLWTREGVPEAFRKLRDGKEALRFLLRELEIPEESQVLVFSKTNGYRHEEAIEAGVPALEAIAKRRG